MWQHSNQFFNLSFSRICLTFLFTSFFRKKKQSVKINIWYIRQERVGLHVTAQYQRSRNKLPTSWLTHDTMRMMVCGCWKKVMGSKAPPAFPAPYACMPSMLRTLLVPSSPSLLQRHRLRGAPGRPISLKLLPLLWLPQHGWTDGWMAASARTLVRAIKFRRCSGWIRGPRLWANKPVFGCCFLRLLRTSRWRTRERAPTVTPLMERPRRTRARDNACTVMRFTRNRDWNSFHKK